MFEQWIRLQSPKTVLEVFNRLSHFLSDRELLLVMEGIRDGREIVDIHIEIGVLDKYRVDLNKIRELVLYNNKE